MNNHSRPAPKLVRDDTPDPCEITVKGHFGSDGALFAFINHFREIGSVKQGRFVRRQDGSIEQVVTVNVYALAKSYATRPERPYEDKSGYVYLLQSLETNGRYKLGESIHPRQREQEVSDDYGERFKIIAVQYVADNRFARETWLKAELVRWGCKHLEREAYQMTDEQVEQFISLPNE